MKFQDVDWRAMTAFDMADVERIAADVHPGFFETPDVLAERQQLYRNGAYILEIGNRAAGYVFSHPWRFKSLPALNTLLGSLPENPDTFFVHDIALLPLARRVGAAGDIVGALIKHAEAAGFSTMSLVAVNGSQGFWERHGFEVFEVSALAEKLRTYEDAARYMVRDCMPQAMRHLVKPGPDA